MVAGSFTIEIDSPVDAERLWSSTKDMHNLLPKQAPGLVSSIKLAQGHGRVGTIREVHFTEAKKNIEGKKVASVSYKIKYVPKSGGGTSVIYTCKYDSFPGVAHDEAKIEEIKAKSLALFQQVEQCLNANHTCNYDSLPGVAHDEARIEEIKAKSLAFFQQVEQRL